MNTNYEAFAEFLKSECVHETIYTDSEGRRILVIGLLDAFTMAHCWGARMVRDEREACAKVCEGRIGGAVQSNEWWGGFREAMKQCASAIRARGQG